MRSALAGCSLSVAVLIAGSPASQTVIHVPSDVSTIRGAITAAHDGDTVLVAPGTYLERIDFMGKAITVASSNGASVTTIDAANAGPAVAFGTTFGHVEGLDSILRGFTVTRGANLFGGGIDCGTATPLIQQCVVTRNQTATDGGGISGAPVVEDTLITHNYSEFEGGGVAGAATLRRCEVSDNHAEYYGGGIYCDPGAQPLIQACTIRGNYVDDPLGGPGGVSGDPRLDDCLIELNQDGALIGAPEVLRCTIRRNGGVVVQVSFGYYYASLGLSGGRVEDSAILDNTGSILVTNGVVLARCLVAHNQQAATGFSTAGVESYGSGGRLEQCTLVDNSVNSPLPGDVGGVRGPLTLVASILRDNAPGEYDASRPPVASYSDVSGVLPGTGNFDLDPLFRDAPGGDFRLAAGSPCIDAGDPLLPLDPDGSRADVGAERFTHATARLLLGSGANPLLLANVTPPAIGTSWQTTIHAALVPGTRTSGLEVHTSARSTPLATPFGESLIDGPRLAAMRMPSNGVQDSFAFAIPPDSSLLGLSFYAQGYVIANPGGVRLGNGLALLAGE